MRYLRTIALLLAVPVLLRAGGATQNPLQRAASPVYTGDGAQAFIENKGQWDRQAQFMAQGPGLNLCLTQNGAVMDGTFLGRSGSDEAISIRLDASDRPAIGGQTSSLDFPVSASALQTTNRTEATHGQPTGIICLLSSDASQLLYGTYVGGSGATNGGDCINGLAVSGGDNLAFGGSTYSTDFPTTTGAFQTSNTDSSGRSGFLAEISLNALVVTNTNDSGSGSLRQAILDCNAQSGGTITFDIPGTMPFIIQPQSGLPTCVAGTTVDATSQPGYSTQPVVEVQGAISVSDGSMVKGLSITGAGLSITNNCTVQGCWIGVHVDGTAGGGGGAAVSIQGNDDVIGPNNVLSNFQTGVEVAGSTNQVIGNYIGTDPTGLIAMGNSVGVDVAGSNNTIGGPRSLSAGNVIAANSGNGVQIGVSANGTDTNSVQGNLIGLGADGTTAMGNGPTNSAGVYVGLKPGSPDTVDGNIIGGNSIDLRNYICGSYYGVFINGVSNWTPVVISNTQILDNYVGITPSGAAAGNQIGVCLLNWIDSLQGNVISAGNVGDQVISGNALCGVKVGPYWNYAMNTTISNCYIGAGPAGSAPLGNGGPGVWIYDGGNGIGRGYFTNCANTVQNNIISANSGPGVLLDSMHNLVQGNTIGLEIGSPSNEAGNQGDGIHVLAQAGAVFSGEGNTLSENSIFGNGGTPINVDSGIVVPSPPSVAAAVQDANGCWVTMSYGGDGFSGANFITELFDLYGANAGTTGMAYLTNVNALPGVYTLAVSNTHIGDHMFATTTAPESVFQDYYQISGGTSELSVPATVVPDIQSFTLSPTTVQAGTSSTGTITLLQATPATVSFNLHTDNAAGQVPATLTIAASGTSTTFNVTTSTVTSSTVCNVTVQESGSRNQYSVALTINPALPSSIQSVTLNAIQVLSGGSTSGSVTLASATPVNAVIQLSSTNAAAQVPGSITINAGSSVGHFTVQTSAVSAGTICTINAAEQGTSSTGSVSLTVMPPKPVSLSVSPNPAVGGSTVTGTVTTAGAIPAGGIGVAIAYGAHTSGPATVTVPAGASGQSAAFTINVANTSSNTTDAIKATYASVLAYTDLGITANQPVALSSVTLTSHQLLSGSGTSGSVNLVTATLVAATVNLQSSTSLVQVPSSVTISANSASAGFNLTTSAVSSATSCTITAAEQGTGSSKTTTLTVLPPKPASLSLSPTSVVGGNSASATLTMQGSVPVAGITVPVTYGAHTSGPASVQVGSSGVATFQVASTGVATAATDTISAKYSGVTASASLTVNPASLTSFTVSPGTIFGTGNALATATLNGFAPPGGALVQISANPNILSLPASITVSQGSSFATFAISASNIQMAASVTITASYAGVTQSAVLRLQPDLYWFFHLASAGVVGGNPVVGTVGEFYEVWDRPGIATVVSSSPVATVPASINVPSGIPSTSGSTTVQFNVNTVGVSATTQASISVTFEGQTIAQPLDIVPASLVSVTASPQTVTGAGYVNFTISLNGEAGPGGDAVNIQSGNPSVLRIASSATILQNQSRKVVSSSVALVASTTTVPVTFTLSGVQKTVNVTVNP